MLRPLTLFFGFAAIIFAFDSLAIGQETKPLVTWSQLQTPDQDTTEQKELVDLLSQMLLKMTPDEQQNAKAISRALKFIQQPGWPSSPTIRTVGGFPPMISQSQTNSSMQSQYKQVWEVQQFLADQIQPSRFWIGVQCEPATEFGLKLDDIHVTVRGGLTITTVTEDSPAQVAGLQVGDIIFIYNNCETNNLEQLVAGISVSEDKESTLEIVRNAERQTIKLTPRLREPQSDTQTPDKSNASLAYLALRDALGSTTLPEGAEYTITLTKFGITNVQVKMGDEESATTSDKLEVLPLATQDFAKRLVDHTEELVNIHYLPNNAPNSSNARWYYGQENQPLRAALNLAEGEQDPVSKSIERLELQVQEILEAVKELQRKD